MSDQPNPASDPAKKPDASERVLKVGGGTDCKKLAQAILGVINREHSRPILEFVGAGACAQAVKAIAIANGMLSRQGLVVDALPCFVTRQFADNHDTTAMQLKLNARAI
jgi:stage V sporulation protein SpoVS